MEPQFKARQGRSTPMKFARLIIDVIRIGFSVLQRCSALWLIGLILSTLGNPACAATNDNGTSYLIGMVRGHVDRSVLYIAPYPGAITSDPSVNEEDLPSVGCRYDIGPEGTDELVDILKGGEINSIAPEKAMPVVDARTAIFIYQNKKRVMMMLILADPLPGETFMRGVWNRRYAVRTGSHLQSALRAFAKSLTPITTHPGCASN